MTLFTVDRIFVIDPNHDTEMSTLSAERVAVAPAGFRFAAVAALLASGAAFYGGTGLHGHAILVWLAPIPVVLLALRSTTRTAAIVAFGAWTIGGLSLGPFFSRVAPIPLVVASIAVQGIAFALSVLAARRVAAALAPWVAVLAFPAAWTSYELLFSLVSPHGTMGSLAYTQLPFLPLVQIASVTGIWGILFVVTLVPAGIALAWSNRQDGRAALSALVLPLLALAVTLGFGAERLSTHSVATSIPVGLAATDSTVPAFETTDPARALPVVSAYMRRVDQLAASGARTIVLPEKFVGVAPAYQDTVTSMLQAAARRNAVWLVAGLNLTGGPAHENIALVISPHGELVTRYTKMHMIPGLESGYVTGTTPGIFPNGQGFTGVAICKDLDFPALGRPYSQAGVGMLLVPAWDFVEDGRLHANMAVMRGIEGGFSIVRSAKQGLLTVSDPYGRMVASVSSSDAAEAGLRSAIAPGPGHTIYGATGDWFGWASVALCVMLLLGTRLATRPSSIRTRELVIA